jgi:hypothetical protein
MSGELPSQLAQALGSSRGTKTVQGCMTVGRPPCPLVAGWWMEDVSISVLSLAGLRNTSEKAC